MTEFSLPVLGFELAHDNANLANSPRPTVIEWADGTPVGILNLAFDPEGAARYEAEQARKKQIQRKAITSFCWKIGDQNEPEV